MSIEELNERIDLLLSLEREHPSHVKFFGKYINYLSHHQKEIGVSYANELASKLLARRYKSSDDKNVVLQRIIKDLNIIRRHRECKLTRLPLSNYLFARSLARDFLKETKPSRFVDISGRALLFNTEFYRDKLVGLFSRMKEARDVYSYYGKFRKVLIIFLVNNILRPDNVRPFIKLVAYLEDDLAKTNDFLSLVEDAKIGRMERFGVSSVSGITKKELLDLMEGGVSYLAQLDKSNNVNYRELLAVFINISKAVEGDPLYDFIYDKENETETIYCRTRKDIVEATKIAQSFINVFSPEVLLSSAINEVFEVSTCELKYSRDVLIANTSSKLELLYTDGVINQETLQKYLNWVINEV